MNSFLIGAFTGFIVSCGYAIYERKFTRNIFIAHAFVIICVLIFYLLTPAKAQAWCDNCKPIPYHLNNGVIKLYQYQGETSERLILEVKALTDEYSFNGSDAFMTSIGAAMATLPSGSDLRVIAISVILANTATYFCKTLECHWKTVYLLNELEYRFYFFKQLGEELLHNRFMCADCHTLYFRINYMGHSKLYFNHYPPCSFQEEGCIYEGETE